LQKEFIMNLIERIKAAFTNKETIINTPDDYCPNCWGRQEYGGNFYQAVRNEIIDLNNIDQKMGWVESYAKKQFQGIQLKNNECPACKVVYKKA